MSFEANVPNEEPLAAYAYSRKSLLNQGLARHGFQSSWPLALVLSLLVFFTTWVYVKHVPLGQPPDEWAHLSYIDDVTAGGPLIHEYGNSTILNSGHQNYLNHPPLYYSVMGIPGRIFHWDTTKSYWRYRTVSALMVAAGIFFWSLIALQWGLGPIRTVGITLAVLAIPMFPYLAGSINNDNLCYLGVAAFFYGVSVFPVNVRRGALFCALGLTITLLTKATGSLFLVVFIFAIALMQGRASITFFKRKSVYLSAIAVVAICSFYYLPTLFRYHTFFPAPGILYQGYSAPEHPLTFFGFVKTFGGQMLSELPVVLAGGDGSSAPISTRLVALFYLMLASSALAWLSFRPFSLPSTERRLSDAFLIALSATIIVHLLVCWHGYKTNGLFTGMQPRYYSYTLPGVFLFSFLDMFAVRRKSVLFFIFSLCAAVIAANVPARAAVDHYIQYRAAQVARLTLPAGPLGPATTLPVTTTLEPVGYLESVRIDGDQAILSGWAVDAVDKEPPRALWVSINGHLLGTVQPSTTRQDVADVLGSVNAAMSGFLITVSGVHKNLSACDVNMAAEQDNGSLVALVNRACR